MSIKHEQLCSLILQEYFGTVAVKIHDTLKWGPKPLSMMCRTSGLSLGCLKKGLSLLINYRIVTFEEGVAPHIAEYQIHSERIIILLRYPRFLRLIDEKFGKVYRLLLSKVLSSGRITASEAIYHVWKSGDLVDYKEGVLGLRNAFWQLISSQYLIRCPWPADTLRKVPHLQIVEKDLFGTPELPLKELQNYCNDSVSCFSKDVNIDWAVNYDRFHQDMRDQLMVKAVERRLEHEAGVLFQIILKLMYLRTEPWATQSNPVPYLEIKEEVEKTDNEELIQFLEQYVKLIEEDSSSFIRKQGEGSSASVYVNVATAIRKLAECSVENLVEYRFGPKAARIFRLVSSKKYIDQEQLQKLVMIPDKEAKQLTYKMLSENFLHLQEVKKSGLPGPVKNFYLLHVNFNQVVNVVLEICYKAVHNTFARAEFERKDNIRLIDKHEKLTALAQGLRSQGTAEDDIKDVVEEWLTPPERAQLQSLETMIDTFRTAELAVDENIFLFELYKYYESASIQRKTTTSK